MARVDGKPKVVNQVYLGSVERILGMAAGDQTHLDKIQVQEFGALWIANTIEREVGLVKIIDSVVPNGDTESGPSVGEYFLYAAFNRMIDACSQRAMPEWYKATAIQYIRPTDMDALDSDRFWKKWSRVDEQDLRLIAERFLARIAEIEPSNTDCFLFDATSSCTCMASDTASELAMRGKISCHILSRFVALCYLRLIELRLRRAGLDITASTAMERMRKLHSCLCWAVGKRKPLRMLETPDSDQALILKAFGHEAVDGGLQKISP